MPPSVECAEHRGEWRRHVTPTKKALALIEGMVAGLKDERLRTALLESEQAQAIRREQAAAEG